MQEFNLASSEKQDEILSNFPIKTGTDFSNTSVEIGGEVVEIHSNNLVIHVSGSGYLININSSYNRETDYTIQIDNGAIYKFELGSNTSIPLFPIRFKNSVKIYASVLPNRIRGASVILD